MSREFLAAINQIASERELPKEVVVEAVETAMVSAYKKDQGASQNVSAKLDLVSGEMRLFVEKQVVESVEDEDTQITVAEARHADPNAQLGARVKIELPLPKNFGRIAAQTAKQVILQRIREAKRDHLHSYYAEKEGELVSGIVQFISPNAVTIALGNEAEAILPKSEQIPGEYYRREQRIRAYICEVQKTNRGPHITVSRTHKKMLHRLLELEVPEIANGVVEIKAIAREAGARSKVAVVARQPGVDPVGSCVGMRGGRIQHIVDELNGEKIDIVQWSPDTRTFIGNALSPAKAIGVELRENDAGGKTARVVVPDKQLSLAIGKEGQNARLAAKLTGWRIDIKSASEALLEETKRAEEAAPVVTKEAVVEAPPPVVPEAVPVEIPAAIPVEWPAAITQMPVEVPTPTGEAWEEDEEEAKRKKGKKEKGRKRELVFDEDLGKVVARTKHKPGRVREAWEEALEELEWEQELKSGQEETKSEVDEATEE